MNDQESQTIHKDLDAIYGALVKIAGMLRLIVPLLVISCLTLLYFASK